MIDVVISRKNCHYIEAPISPSPSTVRLVFYHRCAALSARAKEDSVSMINMTETHMRERDKGLFRLRSLSFIYTRQLEPPTTTKCTAIGDGATKNCCAPCLQQSSFWRSCCCPTCCCTVCVAIDGAARISSSSLTARTCADPGSRASRSFRTRWQLASAWAPSRPLAPCCCY